MKTIIAQLGRGDRNQKLIKDVAGPNTRLFLF